jgi:DNA-binding CsgD family transcriptional regulator
VPCPAICLFVLDQDQRVLFSSTTSTNCQCWHEPLQFNGDKRLTGISGITEHTFRTKIFNGSGESKGVLLKSSPNGEQLKVLIRVTPLLGATHHEPDRRTFCYCIEIQTLDTYYSRTVDRLTDLYGLTNAESKMLNCLLLGESSAAIAEKMNIGIPTLRTHQQRLRSKLNADNSINLVLAAFKEENYADIVVAINE